MDRVKRILKNLPVLIPADYDKEFKLQVDSSDVGAGASFNVRRERRDQTLYPLLLKETKWIPKEYSTVEKKAVALLLAVKFYDVYVSSSPFTMRGYTDRNLLVFINRMQNDNQTLLRWGLTLQKYDLRIHHVKGHDDIVADTLSRTN